MIKSQKKSLRSVIENIPVLRDFLFLYRFIKINRYFPNFKNPRTYNEKINYRKLNAKHNLFSICSDKIAVKDWGADRIGEEYVIPNYFLGDVISTENMKEIIRKKGDCLLKANHNSGPVILLTTDSTTIEIETACRDVNQQLNYDFGKRVKE